jgi:hypothetical protein
MMAKNVWSVLDGRVLPGTTSPACDALAMCQVSWKNYTFQQDGVPKHTAISTRQFLDWPRTVKDLLAAVFTELEPVDNGIQAYSRRR